MQRETKILFKGLIVALIAALVMISGTLFGIEYPYTLIPVAIGIAILFLDVRLINFWQDDGKIKKGRGKIK